MLHDWRLRSERHAVSAAVLRQLQFRNPDSVAHVRLGLRVGSMGRLGHVLRTGWVPRRAAGDSNARVWQLRLRQPKPNANVRFGVRVGRLGLVGFVLGIDGMRAGRYDFGLAELRQLRHPESHTDVQLELRVGLVGCVGHVRGGRLRAGQHG